MHGKNIKSDKIRRTINLIHKNASVRSKVFITMHLK